ncbi:Afadin-like 1 [Homarus americanus]|uniref:Afadin-like 1 n=1 Tax=Homarus americanus TaxID=6706 RepID=A0A8J5N791_HOMAM|nr:Afadin-like 1 [Homarus americanus]
MMRQDGRLQAGDQLLSVDGKSLIGITQEHAAEYMMETGPVVTLEVARQGAIYHGLATILSQPSPHANRASLRKMRPRAEEAPRAAMTNSQSTPNMGGYNERLVDWNQPPRQHPLPPTSSHSSLMARSSPNLAAPAEGTDVNHSASAPTNKPAYAQSKLSPLRTSLPNLGPHTPPLYPPPLISVIPSERVEVGIEHRTMNHTRNNPNLPKYTFTPSSDTSSSSCNISTSSSSSTSSSWRLQQRDVGHGAGCAAIRRGSGPPNLIADSGIDLSCHMHDDAKPWRSLVDVSLKEDVDGAVDYHCEKPGTTSTATATDPLPPQLVSRISCPLLPSRPVLGPSTENNSNRRRPTLRQQMSLAPSIAQSSPSLLLVHSPPSSPSPSQAYPLQLQQASSAAPIGYPGGRHLSERDLPSKVLGEHNQDPPAPSHLHQAPRMQASKSVPSLNSEAGNSVGGKPASLEVFNPSYSRTSSNTSLSQPPNPHFPHHPHHHHQQQPQQPPPQQQPQQQQPQQQQPQQQQPQQQQPPVRSRFL